MSVRFESMVDALTCQLAAVGRPHVRHRRTCWSAFDRLDQLVKSQFTVPQTAFTAAMCRVLFALGLLAENHSLVGVGTYFGLGFGYLLRDRENAESSPHWKRAIAIDTDPVASEGATENLAALQHGECLQVVTGDFRDELPRVCAPISLLFIDLDDARRRKADYPVVLEMALPKLDSNAIVIAHDCSVAKFANDFERYRRFVESSPRTLIHMDLPIDACGVAVTLLR